MKFSINDWSTNTIHPNILEDKELYVTVEDKAFRISSNGNKLSMRPCNRLLSQQEEAETKMFLCAQFVFDIRFERLNIVKVNTNVNILRIYFLSMLSSKIYLQYETSSTTKLYDLSQNSLDWNLVQALPGLYAFSCFNKTSCFERKGTVKKPNNFSRSFLFKFCPKKLCLLTKLMSKAN